MIEWEVGSRGLDQMKTGYMVYIVDAGVKFLDLEESR